jgi:hypothetical protein
MVPTNKIKLFKISDNTLTPDFVKIREFCGFLTDWGVDHFMTHLMGSVKCILVEQGYICKDFRNIYSNFLSKKFQVPHHYTYRFHFFNSDEFTIEDLYVKPKDINNFYIGYSVITPIKDRCIGRTIIDPTKLNHIDNQNFYCLKTLFKVNINGIPLEVCGFPYMSQSTDVTVCAHTALWILCRYLSEKYLPYKEIYPFDIVKMTDSHNGRTFPYRGMSYTDYSNILSTFGTFPVIVRIKESIRDKKITQDGYEDLYSYVESGFPILSSLHGHVNTIIGHTLDFKRKLKNNFGKKFISSSQFVDSFIVVDDNFFPYQKLRHEKFNGPEVFDSLNKRYSINSIYIIVCPLPEKVFLPADLARKFIKKYINSDEFINKISPYSKGPWIVRIFLTNSSSFKKRKIEYLKKVGELNKITVDITTIFMSHFIWVAQIASKDQYIRGLCSAEIILDSTACDKENPIIYTRYGNILYYCEKFVTYKGEPIEFEQYTHNLGDF